MTMFSTDKHVFDITTECRLYEVGQPFLKEGDGLGMNPLILNFRGNALGQLRRYDEAVEDYEEATQIFDADGEARQLSAFGIF